MDQALFEVTFEQARSGDAQAAAKLFAACEAPVRAIIAKQMDRTLARMGYEPADILNEVYASAWAALKSGEFPSPAAFAAWLKTIAKHKMADLRREAEALKNPVLRQVQQGGAGQSGSYVNLLDRASSGGKTPSRVVARDEAVALLCVHIWQLPDDYRQVVRLRFIQGRPVAEVAEVMERTEGSIHMLSHRALLKLRQLMGNSSRYLTMK